MRRILSWADLKQGFEWLFLNLLGAFFPILAGMGILRWLGKRPTFVSFTNRGQFVIFTISLLLLALRIVVKDYKTSRIPCRWGWGIASGICVLAAYTLFVFITATDANVMAFSAERLSSWRTISFYLYSFSLLLTSLLFAFDKKFCFEDYAKAADEKYNKLLKSFRQGGGN